MQAESTAYESREYYENLRNQGVDPYDAMQQTVQRERQLFGAALQQQENIRFERDDARDFRNLTQRKPLAKKYEAAVERAIIATRPAGNYVTTREQVYYLLIGQDMDEKASRETPRQQRDAQRRVARQTTRPGGGRSDGARSTSRSGDDIESARNRTRGVPI